MTDYISRADAIEAACNEMDWLDDGYVEERKTMIKDALSALPSADAEPKWNCTATFVAEQLERLRNMTDEEKCDFFIKFFSPSADAMQTEEKNRTLGSRFAKGGGDNIKTAKAIKEEGRPHGEWIWRTDIPIGDGRTSAGYICSNCGKDYWHGNVFNYCPNCGARMKGGAE